MKRPRTHQAWGGDPAAWVQRKWLETRLALLPVQTPPAEEPGAREVRAQQGQGGRLRHGSEDVHHHDQALENLASRGLG